MEVATDKATVEFNAIDSGFLRQIIIPEGKEAVVNQAIAIFTDEEKENIEGYKPEGESAAAPAAKAAPESPKVQSAPPPPPAQPVKAIESADKHLLASPLAKKLAKERSLDLATVKGTGPGGRIMARDLEKAGKSATAAPTIASGTFELETLTPMRRVIAQRLQEAKS